MTWTESRIAELERKVRALEAAVNGGPIDDHGRAYGMDKAQGMALDEAQGMAMDEARRDVMALSEQVAVLQRRLRAAEAGDGQARAQVQQAVQERDAAWEVRAGLERQIAEAYEVLARRGYRPPSGVGLKPCLATLLADAFAAQAATFTEAVDAARDAVRAQVIEDLRQRLARGEVVLFDEVHARKVDPPLKPGEWRIEVGRRRPIVGVP